MRSSQSEYPQNPENISLSFPETRCTMRSTYKDTLGSRISPHKGKLGIACNYLGAWKARPFVPGNLTGVPGSVNLSGFRAPNGNLHGNCCFENLSSACLSCYLGGQFAESYPFHSLNNFSQMDFFLTVYISR